MTSKEALNLFQINIPQEMNGVRSFAEATVRLAGLKESIRKEYRRRAKELHPDINGSHEKMVELNAAMQLIGMLHVEPPRPRPTIIIFQRSYYGYSNSSATDTGTTFSW